METRPQLERRILGDLAKTGYPLEIRASLVLEAQGWTVTHNPAYLDVEEQKAREVDINAVRAWQVGGAGSLKHMLLCSLFVECKKSDKPWVFFVTPVGQVERTGRQLRYHSGIENLVEGSGAARDCVLDIDFLQSLHPHFRLESRARTYYEPFRRREKGERSQAIFGALSAAMKALLDDTARFQRLIGEHGPAFEWLTLFWYPVVIFSGRMYEATVPLTGDIQLVPSSYVQVAFNHIPRGAQPGADPERFVVDVVEESFLEAYLSSQTAFHSGAAEKLDSCYAQGKVRLRGKEPSAPERGK
jgi:hypothetical protein